MPTAPTAKPKKFACTYDGCEKRFTRSDHLQRHYLNHKGERHLVRHQEKDVEAGGEGLGDLQTRKKLWRDADGRIVTKRPAQNLHADQQQARKKQPESSENSFQIQNRCFDRDPYQELNTALLSPPGTLLSTDSLDQFSQVSPEHPLPEHHQVSQDDIFDFLANSTWGDLPSSSTDLHTDAPTDDMFRPDTASSFNMPFTTMNNYNWLFDSRAGADVDMTAKSRALGIFSNPMKFSTGFNGFNEQQVVVSTFTPPSSFTGFEIPRSNDEMGWDALAHETTVCQPRIMSTGQESTRLEPAQRSNSSASMHRRPTHPEPRRDKAISMDSRILVPTSQPANSQEEHTSRVSTNTPAAPANHCSNTPTVDNDSRDRILKLLTVARPLITANVDVSADNPLLSLSSMQSCLDLFFLRFNVVYPLLHKPTFEPAKTETFLLLAVLLLGATYSDKEMHMLAVCIHDTLRAQIFQHPEFTAQPELWILQTMLLVECFGKSRAGQKQHDMAHLFHGLLINLIRRSDCQTVRQPEFDDGSQDVSTMWRKAIDVELRKRLAFLCFIWDTQHAVLFSQSLCMSSFELRTSLPCNEVTWEATTAEAWWSYARSEPSVSYLSILRAYVNPGSGTAIPALNNLSRLLLLHGLMSIQWDMRRRDQASLGYGPNQANWDERLSRCYDAWKEDFDNHSMNMMLSLSDNPSRRAEFTRFSTATIAIYHAAYITLNVEILDLQIYAGARHIIGRPVFPEDFNRSRHVLREWARPTGDTRAVKAVWHAAQLLKDGIMKLENWDVDSAFHYPWCLYLASLTCWAFHFANVLDTSATSVERSYQANVVSTPIAGEAEEDSRESKAEMIALVSHLATAMPNVLWGVLDKRSTTGLTTVMASHLSNIRWSVVHEATKVLRGLAT
ncbi:hypothetical protein FKW77_000609 [Venturia effusa]|uniref:C2H2-type domain-containing protein n=1 Tax=Venturia effusa TaxID=50376 RepID=A0A517L8F9_9PEZI|nr:hypothetical protein FKW77_000609 [Venturia effusa]